jgi:hypothetical protein
MNDTMDTTTTETDDAHQLLEITGPSERIPSDMSLITRPIQGQLPD